MPGNTNKSLQLGKEHNLVDMFDIFNLLIFEFLPQTQIFFSQPNVVDLIYFKLLILDQII